jgi:NTE family protein
LQALHEAGIAPTHLSGTSAGAIVAALYAYGHAPQEILEIITETRFFKFVRPALSRKGLLTLDRLIPLCCQYLPEDNFEALKIPLTIAATNISKGKIAYFQEGPLIAPMIASSCIPGLFKPVVMNGDFYIDGGVLNNLPVEPLEGKCAAIIGVNCNQLPENPNIRHIKTLIERTVIMSMNYNAYSRKPKCTHFIEPAGLARYGILEIKRARAIYTEGYEATLKYLEEHPEMKIL